MNRKQRQADAVLCHGFALQRLYPESKRLGPVELCEALHRIEAEAHRYAEDLCNGVGPWYQAGTTEEGENALQDKKEGSILRRVRALLGPGPEIILNLDPRGYALKIPSETAFDLDIYKDWGGHGIIAPDF